MTTKAAALCGEGQMNAIIAASGENPEGAIGAIDQALTDFPDDFRLHFLRGSLLIGLKRFIGAHQAMTTAVRLAPDFPLARFQLGFFELTSGEAEAARTTWQPLGSLLPADHWTLKFVEGLEHLIEDRFAQCIVSLRDGMQRNEDNAPLNHDMALIIRKCEELLSSDGGTASEDTEMSATSRFLGDRLRRP